MRKSLLPRRFRHVPLLWWFAAIAVATLTGLVVTQSVSRAEAAASRYEELSRVFVATRALDVGDVVEAGDVNEEQWPQAFLPRSATASDPVGSIVNTPVDEGEPLTEATLGDGGLSPSVALLRIGEQGVAIPVTDATPELRIGDTVDVMATFTVEVGDTPTARVATGARVIAVSEATVTVAVTSAESPKVAFAAAKGVVTMALTRPGDLSIDLSEPADVTEEEQVGAGQG